MFKITRRDFGHLTSSASSAENKLERIKENEKSTMRRALVLVETNLAAGALGFVHGRKGGMPTVMGIPYDAGLAGVALLLGFSGYARGYEDHLINIGAGACAYFTGNMMANLGQRMRKNAGELRGTPWTDDEAKEKHLSVRTITAGMPAFGPGAMAQPANAWPASHFQRAAGWW